MSANPTRLSGWGRYPVVSCTLRDASPGTDPSKWFDVADTVIARGNGRAYGDAAINPALTLSMLGHNKLRHFDPQTGLLTCEAGVLLDDILTVFVPRGWLPAVMPGTKFVSVGGMIAADVHGKNHHHSGTFGRHVEDIELVAADGAVLACSRDSHSEIFRATLGAMGLTGVIRSARFRLMPIETAYLQEETHAAADLDQAMALFEESRDWPYSVAWIDCLARGRKSGRALVSRARPLRRDQLPPPLQAAPLRCHRQGGRRIPFDAPGAVLSGPTVRLFNWAYYTKGTVLAGERIVHYDPFFFPLDRLLEWNRLYGRRGFVQFQCVLPKAESARGLAVLLEQIAAARRGSFLAVLKLLGPEGEGAMSFPMEGYTLALDFPLRSGTLALLATLEKIVCAHGGRIYLAKDACGSPDGLRVGYPRRGAFDELRHAVGAAEKFASDMSRRLAL